ncbi:MAG: M23 family metallopeptidase, partial [Rikenellaceae bacterium]|nr:M23 family metallopeptidase [Rikenellaceae bacterium]
MRKLLTIIALLGCGVASGQPKASDYIYPVDIPVILSGNVGEIRPNHFHSGIDIKTQGVIGKNILAVADGYISRIGVSPTGYGKVLYVNHSNGTTSVYGHLESFNERIGEYVREEQYRRKSFAVDLYPATGRLPVRQGEILALSGNSGSSGGPHLHFEIRDSATQDPLNILGRGLMPGIPDDIPPQFFNLWVIHVDTVKDTPVHVIQDWYAVVKSGSEYQVEGDRTVRFASPGYFAVEVIDTKNGAANLLGLYTLEQLVDGQRNFGLSTDRFSFQTTRHINTMVHYGLNRRQRYEVYRTYVSPQNGLPVYRGVVDRGIVRLNDSLPHEGKILATDDNGNTAILRFTFAEGPKKGADLEETGRMHPVSWDRKYEYKAESLSVIIPAHALYESTL